MAIINTLREKGGRVLVILIVLSLAAFIIGDPSTVGLFGSGPDRDIAEIDGKEITYEDFQAKVDELAYVFALNTNRNPQGNEMDQVKTQAWQSFILENAYQPEFNSIGLEVSDAELIDMVQGQNTHPHVVQMMGNPQTGEFDKTYVTQFLQSIKSAPAQQQQAWVTFEGTLSNATKLMRLDAMMDKMNYVTKAEAKTQQMAQNSSVEIEYVYVPFSAISDSSVSVTEDDQLAYMEANKAQYKREESRDIAYVTFDISPSAADSALVRNEIKELQEGLRTAQNDSSYAARNTDGSFPFMTYRPSSIPEHLLVDGKPIEVGQVTEINEFGELMAVYKMSRVGEAREYSVKASHILVKWEDDSDAAKATAKTKAENVLRRARKGEDFAALASEVSEDLSNAQRGGDLGWFSESGPMVKEFNDPCFAHVGTGVIPKLVETQFGYHIVKIDEPKTNAEYKVAIIEKEYFVSNETIENAYREASAFKAAVENASEFLTEAEAQGLDVQNQKRVTAQATRVGGITEGRALTLWLYNDAEVGSVSDIFELDDQYVIAAMTGIQEEGLARISDVENQVSLMVRNQKKAKVISDKLGAMSGKSLDEMVSGYGEGAKKGEATVTLSSNSITGVGLAPEAVGVAFAMKEGDMTAPVETGSGVIVLKLNSKTSAEDVDDYSLYVQQLGSQRSSRKIVLTDFPLTYFRVMVSQDLENAIKELSGLEDKRHKFF